MSGPRLVQAPAVILAVFLAAGCAQTEQDDDDGADNLPPTALIIAPVDGFTLPSGDPLELRGLVQDAETPARDLRLFWRSDLDGVLYDGPPGDADGNHALFVDDPSAGEHRVSLEVVDAAGATARQEVVVTVAANQPPSCSIGSPAAGSLVGAPLGGIVELGGRAEDPESPAGRLDAVWRDGAGAVLESELLSDGTARAELPARSGPQTVTLVVTDPAGASCSTDVSFTVNLLPSPPLVRIDPDPPSILTALEGVITAESLDPEGAAVTYSWAWLEDGIELPALRGEEQVPSNLLARDELWTLEVRAHDPEGGTSAPGTASVRIPNTPPDGGPLVVAFAPAVPTQAQDLECVVQTPATDPDPGDTVSYLYTWMLDGQVKPFFTSTLPWTETQIDHEWSCVVTPTDGTDHGDPEMITTTVIEGCGGMAFAGTGGKVTVPDALPLRLANGSFTVQAWFQVFDLGGGAEPTVVVGKRDAGFDNGWLLGICGQGAPCSGSVVWRQSADGDPELVAPEPVQLGVWVHAAYQYDPGNGIGTLYVDGQLVASDTMPAPNGATSAPLAIGDDPAGQPGLAFDGVIDDVTISSAGLYGGDFIPDSVFVPGPNTQAWWGFEELSGASTIDLAGFGHDGTLSGAVAFTGLSSCGVDRPPTAPDLGITPAEPGLGVPLVCDAVTPSVDPEGLPVTYSGEWYEDGIPTGLTFTSLPTTLPGSYTGAVAQWACEATASDGTLSSDTVQTATWVGYEAVCDLSVPDPTSPAYASCTFSPPGDGVLKLTMDNPDASLDGLFTMNLGAASSPFSMATGGRTDQLNGPQTLGWSEFVVMVAVDASMGALPITIDYTTDGGSDNAGTDALTIDFEPGISLDLLNAVSIGYSLVGAQDSTPSTFTTNLDTDWFLVLEAADCGTGGGGHSLYIDDDGLPLGDGVFTVWTGDPATCSPGVWAIEWPSGQYDFTLAPEDNDFSNNVGDRAVALFKSDG